MTEKFGEYKIVNITDIVPYARNARTHSKQQIDQIAASIREFGFTNAILIDEKNNLIAGHGRLEAAQKLNMDKVPAIIIKDLTETKRKALILADNKIALNSGWDNDMLKIEFEALQDDEYDLSLLGFNDDELKSLIEGLNEDLQEEKEPELKEEFGIYIECSSEKEQETLFNKMEAEGYKCKIMN